MNEELDQIFSDKLFHYIKDGIIVMNASRKIVKANRAANRLIGWGIGEHVPYCSYCEQREVKPGEERCYLMANKGEIPYFSSEMPTFGEYLLDVEMSNVMIYHDEKANEKYYLLVLRDQTLKKKEEEARISKKMIHKLTEAKEAEHKRLSQELHDGVGQSLFSISIAMDNIMAHINDVTLHDYIDDVRQELGQVMGDVKYYSQALRPKSLDQLGLIATVDSLIKSMKTQLPNTTCHFHHNFDERLHPMIEINVYRVIQEALHNMMKYAQAKQVSIILEKNNDTLYVQIMDDGVGFNIKEKKSGLGLMHMKERISQLKGTTKIESSPGKGAKIKLEIPLEENESDEYINR
ncbi:ATPase [Cerasibacillus terrae]|uniref:Sensor histidine kinase n=1 Tax=Cerasibacillus terrae TaxID=2498845 RepID=A0A5C8NV78_9BACI|nr:ATP-binding protein [Cerasibacillus terrae]TXL65033.1 ATPase [Cerasibacillus terrae]